MSATQVTLRSGQSLSVPAIELALQLEFAGWNLSRDGDRLQVVRRDDSDLGLTEEMRTAIRVQKADLLQVIDSTNEITTSDGMSGQFGHGVARK